MSTLLTAETRASNNKPGRTLLLASVTLLTLGSVAVHAAAMSAPSSKRTVSSLMSAALAAIMVTKTPAPAPAPSPAPTPAQTANAPFQVGINITGIDWYNRDRPFMNLIYGSGWTLNRAGGSFRDMPAEYIDENGWVKALPAGGEAVRMLTHPIVPAEGLDIVCTFAGAGRLNVNGLVSNVSYGAGVTRFKLRSRLPNADNLAVFYDTIDPNNPIRDIDCREATASKAQIFSPEFVANLRPFKILRFMDWQLTNSNASVTWATRNRPGTGSYLQRDGVPVEVMMQLTQMVGADPWVTQPWNSDDAYVRQFATYVRDNLPRDRKVYVEVSNEVWNPIFKVFHQGFGEGRAQSLSSNDFEALMFRYAQRTTEVMRVWTEVFQGQSDRLVRVASSQHANPWTGEVVLGYRDTAQYVDALATAPYFGHDLGTRLAGSPINAFFSTAQAEINDVIQTGLVNKANANRFGKRYITYEAGQHITTSDVPLLTSINRDRQMYNLYTSYMQQWRDRVGGALMLFASTGPITVHGSWGMVEYVGQPASEAPKLQAVRDFRY